MSAPVLPVPPLLGPGAAPPPTAARPATLPRPSRLPEPLLAATPRASLLPAIDPHATLVLPDALKPGGPEAATVERPAGGPGQVAATARDAAPPDAARRPSFDELASPDITMMHRMHHVTMPARPAVGRPRPARAVVDTRAYFLLNLCLGLLIIGGLALLLGRDREAPAAEDHVGR